MHELRSTGGGGHNATDNHYLHQPVVQVSFSHDWDAEAV